MIVRIFLGLLNQKIFQDAARVKFLVPMAAEQAQSERSQRIHELLEDIEKMCSADRSTFVKALYPLVTRVSPDDEEFDIDVFRDTLKQNLINFEHTRFNDQHSHSPAQAKTLDELEEN